MIKVFKWLWDKAEKHGEDKVLNMLYSRGQYHGLKAEKAYLKEKHEPKPDTDRDPLAFMEKTPKEHSVIAKALSEAALDYDRQYRDGK